MEVQIEDSQLVSHYIPVDERAMAVLISRHNSRLTAFIYSKVTDSVLIEDIFLDTFIYVIRSLK